MGNETSFRSFPAHVHNLVTVKLAKSHVVHTKIYPKYKSRKHIEFARDGFGEWLRPHEGPDVDVILLGHSMGGILSAEVALLQTHRILGTVNFDTPFLGIHPGVIASGLGSLFRPAPDSPRPSDGETGMELPGLQSPTAGAAPASAASSSYFNPRATSTSTLTSTAPTPTATLTPTSSSHIMPPKDPNYDPPFVNDVRLPQRSGWANALHFINKHSDGLTKAAESYVKSHLEFGGAMADYNGLKQRYEKLRALEDAGPTRHRRTRFVNYYTVSNGRPKKPKPLPAPASQISDVDDQTSIVAENIEDLDLRVAHGSYPSLGPRISTSSLDSGEGRETDHDEDAAAGLGSESSNTEDVAVNANQTMNDIDPYPMEEDEQHRESAPNNLSETLKPTSSATSSQYNPPDGSSTTDTAPPIRDALPLPPLPPAPSEPTPFDPTPYPDKDTRKLAEKEHARLMKTYRQGVKDRNKAISDRRKFLEKREKDAAKNREKQSKAEEKERLKLETRGMEKGELERAKLEREDAKKAEKERAKAEKEELKKKNAEKKATSKTASEAEDPKTKPPRDKKFCMLPPRYRGEIDSCWVRIFMPGVDEVGAHCGLFFVDGVRYEGFVGDVAGRIEAWVEED